MSRNLPPDPPPASVQVPSGSPLGKAIRYADRYDPSLLFPVARADQRADIGIDTARAASVASAACELPFHGEDLWNAWELSWLNPRGKPVVAIGEFRVPASSPRLIESKSLKLYLNSFNQTTFDSPDTVSARIATDLSDAAGAPVHVKLQTLDRPAGCSSDASDAPDALDALVIDGLDIEIDDYAGPAPQLLVADASAAVVEETLCSHLLKSNCLVTGQPDWGTLFVRYRGRPLDRAGLLRYVVSFRRHHEFHEHCVERVFMDLTHRCAPARLEVWARYTRRGGLDINPWRSSEATEPPPNLREFRQ